MESKRTIKFMMIGRTGDGKTQLCAALAEYFEAKDIKFKPTASAESHRCPPLRMVVPCKILGCSLAIIDTPGLCDTKGAKQDTKNLIEIVNAAKAEQSINVFIFVINERAKRFDSGCQDAVKLLSDTFKGGVFHNMCIMYTRKDEGNDEEEIREHCETVRKQITERCGLQRGFLKGIPFFRVNSRDKESLKVPFRDMLRWAAGKDPYPTIHAVASQN